MRTYSYADTSDFFRITKLYSAFMKRYGKKYSFSGECHNFWEIMIVVSGEVGVTAGSNIYTLKSGQAILHEPMEFHNLWSAGNSDPTIIVISFSVVGMPQYFHRIFEVENMSIPIGILDNIKQNFEVYEEDFIVGIKEKGDIDRQIAVKQLEIFLLNGLHACWQMSKDIVPCGSSNYVAAIRVLDNNIEKRLSVSEIANMCNMSEINLQKTFARYAGMGVMQYFNQQKIIRAITLLEEGNSAKEVAELLGFSNQNYFCTVFKRISGHPPSYYKS